MDVKCEGCGTKFPDSDAAQDRDGVVYNICLGCQDDSETVPS